MKMNLVYSGLVEKAAGEEAYSNIIFFVRERAESYTLMQFDWLNQRAEFYDILTKSQKQYF